MIAHLAISGARIAARSGSPEPASSGAIVHALRLTAFLLCFGIHTNAASALPEASVGTCTIAASPPLRAIIPFWSDAFPGAFAQIERERASDTAAPSEQPHRPDAVLSTEEQLPSDSTRQERPARRIRLFFDAVAFFVHQENDVGSIRLDTLDALFSAERRRQSVTAPVTWGDLGQKGKWKRRAIHLYLAGDDAESLSLIDSTVFLGAKRLSVAVTRLPSSQSLLEAVASDPAALGFASFAFRNAGVRALPILSGDGLSPVPLETVTIMRGEYPFSRTVWLHLTSPVTRDTERCLRPAVGAILSDEGQLLAERYGYIPLPEAVRQAERASLRAVFEK